MLIIAVLRGCGSGNDFNYYSGLNLGGHSLTMELSNDGETWTWTLQLAVLLEEILAMDSPAGTVPSLCLQRLPPPRALARTSRGSLSSATIKLSAAPSSWLISDRSESSFKKLSSSFVSQLRNGAPWYIGR